MQSHAERLVLMLPENVELAVIDTSFDIPKGMCRYNYSELTSFAGGLGGSLPAQRGARGAEPARMRAAQMLPQLSRKSEGRLAPSGEREGRSPLTNSTFKL